MIVCMDGSWLLRLLLQQGKVRPLPDDVQAYSSALLQVEACRTMDRHWKRGLISDTQLAKLSSQLNDYLELIELIEIGPGITRRAADPFALPLGALDAIYLATALRIRESEGGVIHLATFDEGLALAAMAHGFKVITE